VLGFVIAACTTSLELVPSVLLADAGPGDGSIVGPTEAGDDAAGDASGDASPDPCAAVTDVLAVGRCPARSRLLGVIATHAGQVNLNTSSGCSWTHLDCVTGAETMIDEDSPGALAQCQRIWDASTAEAAFDAAVQSHILYFYRSGCAAGGTIAAADINYYACCGQ